MSDQRNLTAVPITRMSMGIRATPGEVFEAFTRPEHLTRFWLAASSGELKEGARVKWTFPIKGAEAEISVTEFDQDRRLGFEWGGGSVWFTVEIEFAPWSDSGTFVEVSERGYEGTGDEIAARFADSTGGFAIVLCSLKAYLEHGIELNAVRDHFR